MGSQRLEGWESRLAAVLKEAESRPWDAKTWNCALFARECAMAVSGRDLPKRLTGDLTSTVDALFPRTTPPLARRGDVVLANLPKPCLGVCNGAVAVFVGENGLFKEPMSRAVLAWSV